MKTYFCRKNNSFHLIKLDKKSPGSERISYSGIYYLFWTSIFIADVDMTYIKRRDASRTHIKLTWAQQETCF